MRCAQHSVYKKDHGDTVLGNKIIESAVAIGPCKDPETIPTNMFKKLTRFEKNTSFAICIAVAKTKELVILKITKKN